MSVRLSTQLRRAPTQYRPVERIASGGMAEVWKAEAIFEDGGSHEVAIKRVLPELASQPLYYSMFRDEAALGMRLRHPNIVRVYDAREVQGTYIIIMELVDGTSLRDLIGHESVKRRIPARAALYIARQVARALDYAHQATDAFGSPLGIIHRDVSPHNVLLGNEGDVKLGDFGLADAATHETDKPKEVAGGKLGYLAPEVIRMQPVDARVDIFALGIVLWEALAGEPLFLRDDRAATVRNIMSGPIPSIVAKVPGAPKGIDLVLGTALARDPEQRYATALELAKALDRLLGPTRVGEEDVARLVETYQTANRPASIMPPAPPSDDVAAMLTHELAQFVRQAEGSDYDIGVHPLDPEEFGELRGKKKKKKKSRRER